VLLPFLLFLLSLLLRRSGVAAFLGVAAVLGVAGLLADANVPANPGVTTAIEQLFFLLSNYRNIDYRIGKF
jgi:hypothetical protein